jgi:hypothetical protein
LLPDDENITVQTEIKKNVIPSTSAMFGKDIYSE